MAKESYFQPTPEDLAAYAKERGDLNISPIVNHSKKGNDLQKFLKKINAPFKYANTVLSHAVAAPQHFAENIVNAPGAASNFLLGTNFKEMHVPEWLDPSKIEFLPDSPTRRGLGMIGDIAGDLATGRAEYKALEKALGFTAKTPLYMRALLGLGEGAASSSSEQPGGRALGATIGGILPLASGLTKNTIGKRAAQMESEASKKYSKLYDRILEEAEKSGVSKNIRVPKDLESRSEDINKLMEFAPAKERYRIQRFIDEPTVKNAHWAQSDLGALYRRLENKVQKGQELIGVEKELYQEIPGIRKRIKGSMEMGAIKSGKPELGAEYGETSEGFAKEVAPLRIPVIAKAQSGKSTYSNAAKELIQSKKFAESDVAKELPGYKTRRAIHEIPTGVKKAVGATAAGLSIPALIAAGVPIPYWLRKLVGE